MGASQVGPGAWRTVWVLTFVYVMAIVDRMALLLLMPGIKSSLGLTDTQMSLLHGLAFALCFAFAGLFLGFLADRWNRRNLLMAGVLGWALATVACGLAQDFTQFFVARMALGACQAVMAPAAISMLADLFPTEQRGRPTALLMAASMFGGALVNFIVGGFLAWFDGQAAPVLPVIGETEPWKLALIGVGVPTLLAIPLLAMIREPAREVQAAPRDGEARFSLLAHVRRHGGLFALLFLFVVVQAVASQGVGNWWPAVFMRSGGLSPAQTGLLLGLNSIVTGVGVALLGGWLGDRAAKRDGPSGRAKVAAVALALQSLTLLPLLAPHSVAGVTATLTFNVILTGIVTTACFSLLPDLVPPQGRGLLVAAFQFIGNLVGFGAGPTLVALVTNHVLQDEARIADAMLMFGLPLLVLSALLAWLAVPMIRRMKESEGLVPA